MSRWRSVLRWCADGLGPGQLAAYWSPDLERKVEPLDDPEVRAELRWFLANAWKAALDAEHRAKRVVS